MPGRVMLMRFFCGGASIPSALDILFFPKLILDFSTGGREGAPAAAGAALGCGGSVSKAAGAALACSGSGAAGTGLGHDCLIFKVGGLFSCGTPEPAWGTVWA